MSEDGEARSTPPAVIIAIVVEPPAFGADASLKRSSGGRDTFPTCRDSLRTLSPSNGSDARREVRMLTGSYMHKIIRAG
jgi:hypothetical protein